MDSVPEWELDLKMMFQFLGCMFSWLLFLTSETRSALIEIIALLTTLLFGRSFLKNFKSEHEWDNPITLLINDPRRQKK